MLNSPPPVLFREVQRFRQLWLWFIVLAISAIAIYSMIQQLVLGRPFGNNPGPDALVLVVGILFGLALPGLFYTLNLTTEVREDGFYYRLFPFHLSFRRINGSEILRHEAVSYRPLRDFGGWGIRYGVAGKAYNVSGSRGVQLHLIDGRHILIGSQKPDELTAALQLITGRSKHSGSTGPCYFG